MLHCVGPTTGSAKPRTSTETKSVLVVPAKEQSSIILAVETTDVPSYEVEKLVTQYLQLMPSSEPEKVFLFVIPRLT